MARTSSHRERRAMRLLLRFFVFFMVALSIPLVGGGVFFAFQIRLIEDEVLQANASTLSLFREIVESTSQQIDTALNNLRQDAALQPVIFMDYPLDLTRITEIATAHRTSLIGKVTDPYLIDLFAYFSSPRILFTQNQIYLNTRSFYPSFYEETGFSHDEWLARFARERYFGPVLVHREVTYNGVSRRVLELRYSLPPVPRIKSRGVVAALIDRDAIASLVRAQLIPHGGVALLLTDDGSVVVEAASDRFVDAVDEVVGVVPAGAMSGVRYLRFEGEAVAVAYERSAAFGWTIVSAVPRNVFLEQSRRIVTLFVVVAAVVFLFGVPLSLLLAYRTSKPLLAMSDILRSGVVLPTERLGGRGGNELNTLSESVYELTQRHASLRQLLEEQKPFVRQVIIDRLLRGDFPSENELLATLRHYEVEIVAPSYGVFGVFIDGYYNEVNDEVVHEFIVKSTLVLEQLETVLPEGSLVHGVSLNRIGVVVSLSSQEPGGAESQIREISGRVYRAINSRDDVRCIVAAGPRVTRLYDVPESLRAAMSAARNLTLDGSRADGGAGFSSYYYPADLESRIVNLVEAGRADELEGLLRSVEKENLEERTLSPRMLQALANELEGTRHKVLASVDPPEHEDLRSRSGDLSVRDYVQRQLQDLGELAAQVADRDVQDHKYKKAILEFVDTHFSDPDMGLKRLAMEFSFSEVYLSYLFRQIAGTTFSAYLEQLRTDEAADLLRTTSMTINEVARNVGYASAHVFRRAFKRRFGISPSAFVDSVGSPASPEDRR